MSLVNKFGFLFITVFFVLSGLCYAGDLDDGISKATDDSISGWDNLGKGDKNVKYIILKSKSQADMAKKRGELVGGNDSKSANMNSVIMGPGSNVRGDIIIIDQSKGDKTNLAY